MYHCTCTIPTDPTVSQSDPRMSQSTNKMVVKVEISADVYLVCLVQALSTEKEEVMGLLIGEARFKLSREMIRAFHSVLGLRLGSFNGPIERALRPCCTIEVTMRL